ncbi:hypothetical protein ACU4IU_06615 [Brevibacterium sp. CSND-B09]|uniref:hypothetical protein n=1 Tax=Brevibacterium sp. CSND-B09 TaxID=3462571 RepID=UPI00406A8D41
MTTAAQRGADAVADRDSVERPAPLSPGDFSLTVLAFLVHCLSWASAALLISADDVYFATGPVRAWTQLGTLLVAGASGIVLIRSLPLHPRIVLSVVTVLLFVPSGMASLVSASAGDSNVGQAIATNLWLLRLLTIAVFPLIVAGVLATILGRVPESAGLANPHAEAAEPTPQLPRHRHASLVTAIVLIVSALIIAVAFAFEPSVGSFADAPASIAFLTACASLTASTAGLYSLYSLTRNCIADSAPGSSPPPRIAQVLTAVAVVCGMAAFMVSTSRMFGDGADLYFGPIAGPVGMGGTIISSVLLSVLIIRQPAHD